jgi:hypothetical protein
MQKIIFTLCCMFCISCGVRKTEKLLNTGNYDKAITTAIQNLANRKTAKSKQDYIILLEAAFAKAKDRDLSTIDMLLKDKNEANFEKIYNIYLQLDNRQEQIKPLLPLPIINQNRNAIFEFENYSSPIANSKTALSKYLYSNALELLKSNNKYDFRKSYDDLVYLQRLNSNYKDLTSLINEAHFKGTDFVNVYTKNETNMIIPSQLQDDLLDFSTYGLNDKWVVYHSNKQKGIKYDFAMIVNFRQINISPEQVKERQFTNEKQIKDGEKALLDAKGNEVKDDKGKVIMVDNFRKIFASVYEFKQLKSCQITAKIDYINNNINQLIETFPITSVFVFENIYANYDGNKDACDSNYLSYFNQRAIPFPTNEQMVYDSGEDLKAKLKNIIVRNKFRK